MTADRQPPHLTRTQRQMLRDASRLAKRTQRRQQTERDNYRAAHDEREDDET